MARRPGAGHGWLIALVAWPLAALATPPSPPAAKPATARTAAAPSRAMLEFMAEFGNEEPATLDAMGLGDPDDRLDAPPAQGKTNPAGKGEQNAQDHHHDR